MNWQNFVMSEPDMLSPFLKDQDNDWYRLWYCVLLGYLNNSKGDDIMKIRKKFLKKSMTTIKAYFKMHDTISKMRSREEIYNIIDKFITECFFVDSKMTADLLKKLKISKSFIHDYINTSFDICPKYALLSIDDRYFNRPDGFFNFLHHCK